MFIVCCVGSGLCDEMNTHAEESYRACVCVCVSIGVNLETSKRGDLGTIWASAAQNKIRG